MELKIALAALQLAAKLTPMIEEAVTAIQSGDNRQMVAVMAKLRAQNDALMQG